MVECVLKQAGGYSAGSTIDSICRTASLLDARGYPTRSGSRWAFDQINLRSSGRTVMERLNPDKAKRTKVPGMKYSEFTEVAEMISRDYHIPISEVEFEVSLYPTDTPAENGIRYFGEIHELMMYQGRVMILSDGTRNIPA